MIRQERKKTPFRFGPGRGKLAALIIGGVILIVVTVGVVIPRLSRSSGTGTGGTAGSDDSGLSGSIQSVTYSISYDGNEYSKTAWVYVPDGYDPSRSYDILYLLHGSGGSGEETARTMAPLFDDLIEDGKADPMLVVFPTYYPDSSFVVSDYTRDYPLNHFFATDEIDTLMKAVESRYHTYSSSGSAVNGSIGDGDLESSRAHRAFGGYSMGGVTTWEVLAYQSQYFGWFMPMAGDCWLDRSGDADSGDQAMDLIADRISANGLTAGDIHVLAMVGGSDGTKYSMQPQIEYLRERHGDLFTQESLIYWENRGGGHSMESMEAEVEHGAPMLFQ